MSKQIKVDLLFNANTVNAQNNIQQLNTLLNGISKNTTIGIDNGPLSQAVSSAQQLQRYLQQATDVDTGKIDLTKLNRSLQQGKTNLQTLMSQIAMAGPQGEQAFIRIANAVGSAQTPVLQLSQRMSGLLKTFANTAKWQVASTAIHAVSGAMTSAISHAKDLDKALNDIRIVTGYGAGTMKTFAAQARDAAKALNTTSTEYAQAALIFYQQGLSGKEVTERADTVIKLSQVTGQTAEQVSSQMTAIWNNFDDGSKSLEYYADVIAKLGAATAASTDEIAQGLEKFAAISDTVGLSYEYATAALATVVDKTRQSADVVGTSFKTIFARIEGLTLGETLEDGTDLNKYSEAMAAVGVNIKESNGDLKDMDTILNELGEKWKMIGKDQQIALAQQVGGLRQYNQMIALMDNWDDVKDNIELAVDATGELQEQADIWGESWEAASKRVKANSQELYESFLNSDDIVNLTNALADFIKGINGVVDAFGGIGPMVLTIIGLFSQTLIPMVLNGLSRTKDNLLSLMGVSNQQIAQTQATIQAELKAKMSAEGVSEALKKQYQLSYDLIEAKKKQAQAIRGVTAAQKEELEASMQNVESLNLEVQALYEKQQVLEKENREQTQQFSNRFSLGNKGKIMDEMNEKYGVSIEDIGYINNVQKTSLPIGEKISSINRLEGMRQESISMSNTIKQEIAAQGGTATNEQQEKLNFLYKEQQDLVLDQGRIWKDVYKEMEGIPRLQGKSHEELRKMVAAAKEYSELTEKTFKVTQNTENIGYGPEQKAISDELMKNLALYKLEGGTFNADTGELKANASMENIQALILQNEEYKASLSSIKSIQQDINDTQSSRKNLSEEELSLAQKIAKAQKDVAERGKKGSGYENAQKELKKLEKELSKYDTTTQANIRTSAKFTASILKSKDSITELAKKAGATKTQTDKLDEAFDAFNKGNFETGFTLIKKTLGDLKIPLEDAVATTDRMAEELLKLAKTQGMSEKEIDEWVEKLREEGKITAETADKMKKLNQEYDELNNKQNNAGSGALKFTTKLGTLAGTVMTLAGVFNQLTSLFKEGGSAMEWVMGISMALISVMPILSGLIEKQTAAKKKEKLADDANTVAKVANWFARNPIAGAAILAGIVVAIAAITAITQKDTKTTKENTEAQIEANKIKQETIDTTLQAADALREETEAMDELVNRYNRLTAAGQDTAEAQQAIIDQVPSLIEKYEELNKTLENSPLTSYINKLQMYADAGDIEGLIRAMDEAESAAIDAEVETAKEFKVMSAAEARKAIVDNANRGRYSEKGAEWAVGTGGNTGAALAEAGMLNGRFVKLRTDTNENFIEDYEKLDQILKDMDEAGHADEAQYAKLKTGLDAAREQYNSIKETMDSSVKTIDLDEAMDDLGIDPADIKSLNEYTKAKEKFIETATASGKVSRDEAEAYFETKAALKDFSALENQVAWTREERGDKVADDLAEYLNGLDPDQLQTYLDNPEIAQKYQSTGVKFSEGESRGALQGVLEMTQEQADAEAIEARVEFLADFEGFADKTDEELMEIANNADYGWGTELMRFDQFLTLSAEEQKAYMAEQAEIQAEKNILIQQQAIETGYLTLATAELTEAERQDLILKIQAAENQKAIYEFQKRTRELERKKELKSRQEKIDALEEEIDLLHEIDVLQEDINDSISEYSKLADRAYGKDKLNYLQEEIKWMEKDIMVQEKRVEMTKDIMDSRRAELEAAIPDAQFDEEGRISNYNELLTNKIRETQQKIANTSDSDKIEEYEQELEDFKEFLEKYEDAAEDNQKAIIELAEKEREQLDKQLEGIEYAVEVKIEVEDRKLEQFKRRWEQSQVGGDIMDIPANLVEYSNNSMASLKAKNSYNISGIDAILSSIGATPEQIAAYMSGDASAISGLETRLTEEQISALEKYTDGALETAAAMEELATVVNGQLNEAFTKTKDTIDTSISAYSTYSTMAQDFRNIIDTVGADVLGITETVERGLNKIIIDSAINTVEGTKTQIEVAQNALDEVNKILTEQELTPEARAYFEEQKKFYEQELLSAEAAFSSALSTAFQTIQEEFTRQIETAIDEFEDALAGVHFGSLEELSDAMEKAQKVSERYVTDYKKIYELNKLNRNIQKSLDQSTSLRTNSKLRDFQSEITELQAQGVELSEYQLEHVQKRYELLQAEIALEEARDAKNQVRLQRDQSGSWNYVYTIDEESVNDAAQGYEDVLYEYMAFQDEALNDQQSRIIESQRSMVEELMAIQTDMSLTTQEKEAATARIVDYYVSEQQYLYGQLGITLLNNKNFYDGDYTNYSYFVSKQLWTTDEWVQGFNETVLSMQTGYDSIEEMANSFMEALGNKDDSDSILGKIHDNWMTYEDTLEAVAAAAEAPIGKMGDQVSGLGDIIAEKLWGKDGSADKPNGGMVGGMNDFKDSVDKAGNEAASAFPQIGTAIGDFYKAHYDQLSATREQAENLDTALTKLKTDYTEGINIKVDVKVDNTSELDALEARLNAMKNTSVNVGINATGGNKTDQQGNNGLYSGGYNYNEVTNYLRSMGANDAADTILGETDFINKVKSGDPAYAKYNYGRNFGEQGSGSYASYLYDQVKNVDSVQNGQAVANMEANRLSSAGSSVDYDTYDEVKTFIQSKGYDTEHLDYNKSQYHLMTEGEFYNSSDFKNGQYENKVKEYNGKLTAYEIYLHEYKNNGIYEKGYVKGDDGSLYYNYPMDNIGKKTVYMRYNDLIDKKMAGYLPTYDRTGKYISSIHMSGGRNVNYANAIKNNAGRVLVPLDRRYEGQTVYFDANYIQYKQPYPYVIGSHIDPAYGAHGDKYENRQWKGTYPITIDGQQFNLNYIVPNLGDTKIGEIYHYGTDSLQYAFQDADKTWWRTTWSGLADPSKNIIPTYGDDYIKDEDIWKKFDTGGYTGSWGPEGKLAVLHQKELILNAMDTENILSAVSLVRDISSQLDRNAAAMANSLSLATSPMVIQTTGNDTLQQDVHITAEFPSVTNHNEIEIALSNLINDASQYINKR